MNSIIIKNVPQNIINKIWTEISYDFFIKKITQIDKIDNKKIDYWTDEEIETLWMTSAISSNSF